MNGSALASAHPWLSLPRAHAWVAKRDADLALTVEPGERASSDVLFAVSPLFVWEAGKEAQRTAEWWGPFQPGREPADIVNRAIATLQAALRSGAVAAKGVRGNVHESRGDDIEDISTHAWALLAIEHRAMILAAVPDRAAGSTLHTFWRGILIDTGSLVRAFPPPTDPIWLGRALSEGAALEDPVGGMTMPAPDTVAPPTLDPDPVEASAAAEALEPTAPATDWVAAWALASPPFAVEPAPAKPEIEPEVGSSDATPEAGGAVAPSEPRSLDMTEPEPSFGGTYRTGASGRPSSKHLVTAQAERLRLDGATFPSQAKAAEALSAWLREAHPDAAPMKPKHADARDGLIREAWADLLPAGDYSGVVP